MNKKKLANFIAKNFSILIILTFGITILAGIGFCYYFLPILLNYGPGSINTEFDKTFSGGLTYFLQFVLIFIAVFSIGYIWIFLQTKDFKNIKMYMKDVENNDDVKNKLTKIKIKCVTIPFNLFMYISLIPTLGLLVIFRMLGFTSIADLKVVLIVAITSLLIASLGYLILKSLFKSILISINNIEKIESIKISLTKTLLMQFLPLIIVCILYTFLITYSVNMEDKSEILKYHYMYTVEETIKNSNINSLEELQNALNSINFISYNDEVFMIDNQRKLYQF